MSKLILVFLTILGPRGDIPLTRWIDPLGRKPIKREEFEAKRRFLRERRMGTALMPSKSSNPLVDILVNTALYEEIQSSLEQFVSDLESEGYSVRIDTVSGGTPADIRSHLNLLLDQGLVGAIFIGNLPFAWYHMDEPGWGMTEEFPIDYYFMDLDGNWSDSNGDGFLDEHSGDREPEIWVGRLYADALTMSAEKRAIERYFQKNHAYRTGNLTLPDRALSLIDDDWIYWYDTVSLDLIFDTVDVLTNPYATTAEEYRNRLREGYSFVHIASHSSPWGHTFKPLNYGGTYFNFEIFPLNPRAFFYNLFSCSATRFVENDDIGNSYLYYSDYGLLVVGSTKTGAMYGYYEDFYGPLASGRTFGDAFKHWMTLHAEGDPGWNYGLCLLGDPTLTIIHSRASSPLGSAHAPGHSWPTEQVSTNDKTDAQASALYLSGDLYVTWSSGRKIRGDIMLRYLSDGVWSAPFMAAYDEMWDFFPVLTHRNGKPWIVWQSMRDDDHNIYAIEWEGSAFSDPIRITSDSAYDLTPDAVSLGDTAIAVAFLTWRNGNADIYLAIFGDSFFHPFPACSSSEAEMDPSLVIDDSGRLWLFYSRRTDVGWRIEGKYLEGITFSDPVVLSSSDGNDRFPDAALDSAGRLWVLWQEDDETSVALQSAYIENDSVHGPFTVCDEGLNYLPMIASGESALWACWTRDNGGDLDIYISSYTDSSGWLEPVAAVDTDHGEMWPDLLVVEDTLYIVYQSDASVNWDIYLTRIDPGGIGCREEEASGNKLKASTFFTGAVDLSALGIPEGASFEVYDVSGRKVHSGVRRNSHLYLEKTGIYFYRVEEESALKGRFLLLK